MFEHNLPIIGILMQVGDGVFVDGQLGFALLEGESEAVLNQDSLVNVLLPFLHAEVELSLQMVL